MPYPLPSDAERRALFAWLKQASSLSAWRRLYSLHQVFVDAVTQTHEDEQRCSAVSTIPTNWVAHVLRDHDAFLGAVDRLAVGDRRCFAFLGARGHFSQGLTSVRWWQDMYGGSVYGRNGFGPDQSPRWPEIAKAMHECLAAAADIGVVLQKKHSDLPAAIEDARDYYRPPFSTLIRHLLADPGLQAVPAATDDELIHTGQPIPCYGIWEPVQAAGAPDMLSTLRRRRGATAALALDGCMNYLLMDVPAPAIGFPEDDDRRSGRATTWRLLWRDERYAGGAAAPSEEASYVFVQPVPGEVLFRYA